MTQFTFKWLHLAPGAPVEGGSVPALGDLMGCNPPMGFMFEHAVTSQRQLPKHSADLPLASVPLPFGKRMKGSKV